MTTAEESNDNTWRCQLIKRMRADYDETMYRVSDTLDPLPYREQFNPTFLFHADVLKGLEKQGQEQDVWMKCYKRNNLYICVLTVIHGRALIFLYRIKDPSIMMVDDDEEESSHGEPFQRFFKKDSGLVVLHGVHDATKDIRGMNR